MLAVTASIPTARGARDRHLIALRRAVVVAILACSATSYLPAQSSLRPAEVLEAALGQRPQIGVSTPVDPFLGDIGSFANIITSSDFYQTLPQTTIQTDLLGPLNAGIATQLSTLPIASASSGVVYSEDKATGVLVPSRDSLGPIFSERPETIGRGRWYFAFTRQQFRFDNLEGADPTNFKALDEGGDPTFVSLSGVQQLTAPTTSGIHMDLRLDQNVALVTYGLTRRLDVSAVLTTIRSSVAVDAFDALIHNTGDPLPGSEGGCFCGQTYSFADSLNSFDGQDQWGLEGFRLNGRYGSARATASGLGDTTIRVKAMLLKRQFANIAAGVDARVPTGKALDYHGVGAWGLKPFVAVSFNTARIGRVRVVPFANSGFQLNGDSILAAGESGVLGGAKEQLPRFYSWSAGATVSPSQRFTFTAEFLGQTVFDTPRYELRTVSALGAPTAVSQAFGITDATGWTTRGKANLSMVNGAFGIKAKLIGNLVAQSNLLVALENRGLRDKVVPLFGLGYTF